MSQITKEQLATYDRELTEEEREYAQQQLQNTYGVDISMLPEQTRQILTDFALDGASTAVMRILSNIVEN